MINNDNKELTDPNDILQEEENFYKNLYCKKPLNTEHVLDNCSFMKGLTQLTESDKNICDSEITLIELSKNLKELPNNKSPGCDGFTADFYKFFWKDLKDVMFSCLKYCYKVEKLSIEQRRAVLCLLPKTNKDIRYLKNWRPLSLLNTDYKLIAKTLSTRLQKVIDKIIKRDQSGYIKGRFIGESVRTIIDVLEYSSLHDIAGYILFLDFEKAFDSISWDFMFRILKAYNFGERFIKWIKILYTETSLCVTNNGHCGTFFPVTRGIRQGCPISALLFLLVVEAMAEGIRNTVGIKGIDLDGVNIKITQLADDTTLFLRDKPSILHTFSILHHFEKCAGLRLNKEKSESMILGRKSPEKSVHGIKVSEKPIKVLGVWLSKDTEEITSLNFNERVEKLKNLLNMWRQRKLSLKGKITIINCLALSQIMYIASVLYIPQCVIENVNDLILSFLWPKKVHVKHTTIIAPICEGGLRMPHFQCKISTCKTIWIKRILKSEKLCHFIKIFGLPLSIQEMCRFNYDITYLQEYKSKFYKQVLDCWYKATNISNISTATKIREQFLWFNKNIVVDNKPLYIKTLYEKSLLRVNDILDEYGKFIDINELNRKYVCDIDIMTYNSLKDSIPRKWRNIVRNSPSVALQNMLDSIINISLVNGVKSLANIEMKDIYWTFVSRINQKPTSISKWQEKYPSMCFDWKLIFNIPYVLIRDTTVQNLQYKILHRFFPCNYTLNKWHPEMDKHCMYCKQVDTIEHYFYDCPTLTYFWSSFFKWWYNVCNVRIELHCLDVVLGIQNHSKDAMLDNLNYCLLLAKMFIYDKKYEKKVCDFYEYQKRVKDILECEKFSYSESRRYEIFEKTLFTIYENL